jgi:hypothetical protein
LLISVCLGAKYARTPGHCYLASLRYYYQHATNGTGVEELISPYSLKERLIELEKRWPVEHPIRAV